MRKSEDIFLDLDLDFVTCETVDLVLTLSQLNGFQDGRFFRHEQPDASGAIPSKGDDRKDGKPALVIQGCERVKSWCSEVFDVGGYGTSCDMTAKRQPSTPLLEERGVQAGVNSRRVLFRHLEQRSQRTSIVWLGGWDCPGLRSKRERQRKRAPVTEAQEGAE